MAIIKCFEWLMMKINCKHMINVMHFWQHRLLMHDPNLVQPCSQTHSMRTLHCVCRSAMGCQWTLLEKLTIVYAICAWITRVLVYTGYFYESMVASYCKKRCWMFFYHYWSVCMCHDNTFLDCTVSKSVHSTDIYKTNYLSMF